MPFIRAHLAALSEPLCAALYGDFKENSTREIWLRDVDIDAFNVMQRASHHLDPKLTPERAISTLKAADLYLIDDLRNCCLRYLNNLPGFETTILTVALKASFPLPKELALKCCQEILQDSRKVVESSLFLGAHGKIIQALLELEELDLDEELLWSRLPEWSASAVQNPELLGPFAEAAAGAAEAKRCKTEPDGLGSNEAAQQGAIVQMISKHIRFAAMSKEFFWDTARPWLRREDIDAVISTSWLGRPSPERPLVQRSGLFRAVPLARHAVRVQQLSPTLETENIQNLIAGSRWDQPSVESTLQLTLSPGLNTVKDIVRVELSFCSLGTPPSTKLQFIRGDGRLYPQSGVSVDSVVHRCHIFKPRPHLLANTIFSRSWRILFRAQDSLSSTSSLTKEPWRPNMLRTCPNHGIPNEMFDHV